MGFVHIAFIECVLDGAWHLEKTVGLSEIRYVTSTDNAEISLLTWVQPEDITHLEPTLL